MSDKARKPIAADSKKTEKTHGGKQPVLARKEQAVNLVQSGKSQTIQLKQDKKEPQEITFAKLLLQPDINSTETISQFQSLSKQADLTTMLHELRTKGMRVQSGDLSEMEAILVAQVVSLDNIFHNLAQRAGRNVGEHMVAADTYLRMALKAQSQCRTTVEALAEIKYPKSATFIRQANIANQQQVNNGQPGEPVGTPAPAQEKNITPTNKLLTEAAHAPLDARGAGSAIGINPQMETMGAVNRPEVAGGEKRGR